MPEHAHKPIDGAAAWTGGEIARDPSWIHRLTAAEIAELDRAIKSGKAKRKPLLELTRDDFDLLTLAPVIRRWMDALNRGRGFVLVKGFPVFDYTTQDLEIAYWALGRHMGDPVPQNRAGDHLGHVRDTGELATTPKVRLYKTTKRQDEDFDEPEKKRHLLRLWLTAREFEDGDERLRKGFANAESK